MSKKRKRRPSRPQPVALEETPPATETAEGAEDEPPRRPPSPYPTLPDSVGAAMKAVARNPSILVTAFLSLLATWTVLVALGSETSRALGLLMAIPPAHLSITDLGATLGPGATIPSMASLAGLLLLRAVLFSLLILLLAQVFRGEDLRLGRAVRSLPGGVLRLGGLLLLEAAGILLIQTLAGSFIGGSQLLVLAAGVYFTVYAAVVAVLEDVPPVEAVRRGFRAVRLPGTRHLTLVMAYLLVLIYLGSIGPFGVLAPATPSFVAWSLGLLATFLHVSVLGAFVYRWLAVRHLVPEGPAAARTAEGRGD